MKGKAIRRHHKNRIVNKMVFVQKNCWHIQDEAEEDTILRAKMMADNRACGCPMCGNPRKWFNKKKLQELKAELP